MKKCPYCAEEIQDEAVKCRHCGEYIKRFRKWRNCLVGCLIAFLVGVVGMALFIYLTFFALKFIVYKVLSTGLPVPYAPFDFGHVGDQVASLLQRIWEWFGYFFQGSQSSNRITF